MKPPILHLPFREVSYLSPVDVAGPFKAYRVRVRSARFDRLLLSAMKNAGKVQLIDPKMEGRVFMVDAVFETGCFQISRYSQTIQP